MTIRKRFVSELAPILERYGVHHRFDAGKNPVIRFQLATEIEHLLDKVHRDTLEEERLESIKGQLELDFS